MLCVWEVWMLLLLVARLEAQSGDSDSEPRLSCTSHIMTDMSSLTCDLVGGGGGSEDDEDGESNSIERIRMCFTDDWSTRSTKCFEGLGGTVSSSDLSLVVPYNVSVHLKRGGPILTTVDLKKIVKPRSPWVFNVTFNPRSNQAVFHIGTPYHREYLTVEKQLFQLFIWSADTKTSQNVSSSDTLKVDMGHLQANTRYYVRVRAIPLKYLQGTWSEWGRNFTFMTPEGKVRQQTEEWRQINTLTVCLVVLLLTFCAVFSWKMKIFSYMWPRIPHPKDTLVQICKPNKGLLLSFRPEEFSVLKVFPKDGLEDQPYEEPEPLVSAAPAENSESTPPCSTTQTSECSTTTTSVSTEELELSALLGRSSSDEEDSLQSFSPSPIDVEQRADTPQQEGSGGGNLGEVFGVSQQEEAYVTMSSFFKIQ
ncbi:interleukin-7 receptor subunit alpha-like [Xyrichtys novacula]|uniref:Interleukin-7 receptor subunit alpha-like n=1 Tax=Xyrichtys novacula TaxID=13765 RepID=A0AAV1G8Q7_XYRNO|nr:interleukin-7 receptor subunit alpha-like [Xyrichtys novacula]